MEGTGNHSHCSLRGCVFICGSTGVGKSAIAIQLAKRLKGEIVNADAFQIYKGLDIATAKVTENEMDGVRHHLLGAYDESSSVNVKMFRDDAIEVIRDIHSRGHLAVIVGGTSFYVEELLFDTGHMDSGSDHEDVLKCVQQVAKGTAEEQVDDPHAILSREDPTVAASIHPNDKRRVLRALQILRQKQSRACNESGGGTVPVARYSCAVVIVHCEWTILQQRLRARVDKMVDMGLVAEARAFYERSNRRAHCNSREFPNMDCGHGMAEGEDSDSNCEDEVDSAQSRSIQRGGLTAAIGYKELLPLLGAPSESAASMISANPLPLLLDCIEKIKTSTCRYAKRQRTWLRNRIEPTCQRIGIPVFFLDSSEAAALDPVTEAQTASPIVPDREQSLEEALKAVYPHLTAAVGTNNEDSKMRFAPFDGSVDNSSAASFESLERERLWRKRNIFTCAECGDQAFQGHDQYMQHMHSKKHRKRVSAAAKRKRGMGTSEVASGMGS